MKFFARHPRLKWTLRLFGALVLLIALGVVILWVYASRRMGELPNAEEEKRYAALDYYQNGFFVNYEPVTLVRPASTRPSPWLRLAKMLLSAPNAPQKPLPLVPLTRASFSAERDPFSVRWLGHANMIFELDGVRFITDPVFGNAAPIPGIVSRYTPSPLPRTELPELDFVLITHDHYDHLEYETIRALRDSTVPFVTSLGVGARLRGWGIGAERIHELGWGDAVTLGKLQIQAFTARHFSGRTFAGRNKTLWSSFVISGPEHKIYLAADGGYGKHFKEIGDQYGPFDLVCMEIDAWNENWPYNHLFPAEAIKAMRELRGARLMPVHWGVFDLAMHPWDASIRELVKDADEAKLSLVTPVMGEKVTPGVSQTTRWWEESK